ncbi:hypothetical protein ADL08_34610 [Streptomyces sp. NRRL F-6492]|nr:hypothetical protein ADL08_34610 [Streptomyces sp. NRRL F-6492]
MRRARESPCHSSPAALLSERVIIALIRWDSRRVGARPSSAARPRTASRMRTLATLAESYTRASSSRQRSPRPGSWRATETVPSRFLRAVAMSWDSRAARAGSRDEVQSAGARCASAGQEVPDAPSTAPSRAQARRRARRLVIMLLSLVSPAAEAPSGVVHPAHITRPRGP